MNADNMQDKIARAKSIATKLTQDGKLANLLANKKAALTTLHENHTKLTVTCAKQQSEIAKLKADLELEKKKSASAKKLEDELANAKAKIAELDKNLAVSETKVELLQPKKRQGSGTQGNANGAKRQKSQVEFVAIRKDINEEKTYEQYTERLADTQSEYMFEYPYDFKVTKKNVEQGYEHAVLGLITEKGKLTNDSRDFYEPKPISLTCNPSCKIHEAVTQNIRSLKKVQDEYTDDQISARLWKKIWIAIKNSNGTHELKPITNIKTSFQSLKSILKKTESTLLTHDDKVVVFYEWQDSELMSEYQLELNSKEDEWRKVQSEKEQEACAAIDKVIEQAQTLKEMIAKDFKPKPDSNSKRVWAQELQSDLRKVVDNSEQIKTKPSYVSREAYLKSINEQKDAVQKTIDNTHKILQKRKEAREKKKQAKNTKAT